ncbi:DUF6455 family protein [Pseudoprimorskyibacter insulae]|uniref:DUF6455 domain-containing protein n=1 Tax=Pseudoprimorskyibacter insulae TaxID=1695997 RepID=A0A2R8AZ88_9RHOB|nr:DUF6455 family protein [Pseudoprimorskyibacter insulae]SPF81164.1 hypothetical protein PRI8871_02986 [Pseudoprimorskyibacter insulae]
MIMHLGDPVHHFWLTRSVARVLGLNLADEMRSGHLSEKDYAGMITRCRTCPHVAACQEWLSDCHAGGTAPLAECRNSDLLTALRQPH